MVKIRKARKEDLKDIIELNQKLFGYEYKNWDNTLDCSWPSKNRGYFKKSIIDKDSLVLVAIDKGNIVGYFIGNIKKAANYGKIKKIAEGDNAYILSDYQRKGIGSEFYKRFFKWARAKGVMRVKVVVSSKNVQSLNWHNKVGFEYYDICLEKKLK